VTVYIFGFAVGFGMFYNKNRGLWLFTNKIPHVAGSQIWTKNNVHSNSITCPNGLNEICTQMMQLAPATAWNAHCVLNS